MSRSKILKLSKEKLAKVPCEKNSWCHSFNTAPSSTACQLFFFFFKHLRLLTFFSLWSLEWECFSRASCCCDPDVLDSACFVGNNLMLYRGKASLISLPAQAESMRDVLMVSGFVYITPANQFRRNHCWNRIQVLASQQASNVVT